MHYNCLMIEDETELAGLTCEYFEMFGVSCTFVENPNDCFRFFEENEADLLLLDINLGQESGFVLCKKLRERTDIPILFLSARQSDDDVLIALNIGGDDYIKKPYSLSVLLAKVKVILKRMSAAEQKTERLAVGHGFFLDRPTFSVTINGRNIRLKAKEFELLECLYERKNTIVTKQELFEKVWGDSFYSDGTLNVHIRKLREKIEETPNEPKRIKTVWGTGYILEID